MNVPDRVPPEPPKNFKAIYDEEEKKVVLTWLHSPSGGTSAYVIFRGSKEEIKELDTVTEENAVGYKDRMVKSGDVFYYAVKAEDMFNNQSVPTEFIKVALPDTMPPPPPYGLRLELT